MKKIISIILALVLTLSVTGSICYAADSDLPQVDLTTTVTINNVEVSSTTVAAGQSVQISVSLTCNKTVTSVDLSLYHTSTKTTLKVPMTLDESTGLYVCNFDVTASTASGEWKTKKVTVNSSKTVSLTTAKQKIISVLLLGDVNLDSSINSSDALLVLQYVVNLTTLTEQQLLVANTSMDSKVSSYDALRILEYSVGKITSF